MRIVAHVDRVVLDGLPNADPAAFGDQLRSQLARSLADPAIASGLPAIGRVARMHAGEVRLTLDGGAARLGASTARAIAARLSR